MNTQPAMPEVMARIETAIQRVLDAIAPLSPEQLTEPRLAGGRSVKDVLAHLTWWDQWLLYTLPAAGAETQPPPLFEQIPATDHWADAMNATVDAYYQQQELAPIQAAFQETLPRLVQRVGQLSHDDMYDPAGMSAQIGHAVGPLVLGIYEHYEEHADEFEAIRW